VTTFLYDKAGNRQGVSRATSTGTVFSTTGYTYDTLNRLTDITNLSGGNGLVSKFHYVLRADGKRLSVTETGPATNGGTTNYTYDDQGKLTLEAGPYATIAYGYDNVGNRLTRTVTGSTSALLPNGTTTDTYDLNDRIATVNGSVTHTYDLDGNETTVNGQAAGYDFENHLVGLGSAATAYVYDADGNRVSVSSAGTTTSYVVDTSLPYASVIEEYAGTSTAPSARYDYGDDLIRMDRGSGVYYYLYDGLGSTRQLVNTSGTVTDSYGYSAFGEMASHTGNTVNPFLFNAQQFDGASGDYYLRARYYDQSNGRLLGQDPFEGSAYDPVTLHRYLYATNDPIDFADPSGKEAEETLAATATESILSATILPAIELAGTGAADSAFGAVADEALNAVATEAESAISGVADDASEDLISEAQSEIDRLNEEAVGQDSAYFRSWARRQVFGRNAENFAQKVLDTVGNFRKTAQGPDFVGRIGSKLLQLEAKSNLPSAQGQALTRLVGQIRFGLANQAARGPLVVWSLSGASSATIRLLQRNLTPDEFNQVQFVDGLKGLFDFLKFFSGK